MANNIPRNYLSNLQHVVAIGGGYGLGRVMSSLSFLGTRLTGIVTTTDNGGSTGRIRHSEGGIAWGDIRNCINQLITEPSVASTMFEYRFIGTGELSGHNLGNLMLKALDNLSVRPLDAINLIRSLLKVDAYLIPMSEQPSDLMAIDQTGNRVHGEVNVDLLLQMPQLLMLDPPVDPTEEAIEAINDADLILIGPGSFMTSVMPPLLLPNLAQAINDNQAPVIFIDNLGQELSPAAGSLALAQKIYWLEQIIGTHRINAILAGTGINTDGLENRNIAQQDLADCEISYRHDRERLKKALSNTLIQLGLLKPA